MFQYFYVVALLFCFGNPCVTWSVIESGEHSFFFNTPRHYKTCSLRPAALTTAEKDIIYTGGVELYTFFTIDWRARRRVRVGWRPKRRPNPTPNHNPSNTDLKQAGTTHGCAPLSILLFCYCELFLFFLWNTMLCELRATTCSWHWAWL